MKSKEELKIMADNILLRDKLKHMQGKVNAMEKKRKTQQRQRSAAKKGK